MCIFPCNSSNLSCMAPSLHAWHAAKIGSNPQNFHGGPRSFQRHQTCLTVLWRSMHPEYFHVMHGLSAAIKNLDTNTVFSKYTSCAWTSSEVLEQADAEYGYQSEILSNFKRWELSNNLLHNTIFSIISYSFCLPFFSPFINRFLFPLFYWNNPHVP